MNILGTDIRELIGMPDRIGLILLSVLAFFFIIQLVFYWIVLAKPYYHLRSIKKGNTKLPAARPPVSVIVCIRNEHYDLRSFLPPILEQDYPEFEVIVVNDGVTEESADAVTYLKNQYENLYSTHIPKDTKNVSRKKLGLTLGVKAAKYDTLLFTEADSAPRTSHWISSMARHFQSKKTIVLGLSAAKKKKGFSRAFFAYDYFFTNIQMMSLALLNRPYAGNGRNLAYLKNHFNAQKGFLKYSFLELGEDDLFVKEIASSNNTSVELSPESIMSVEINDFYDWKNLKIRNSITKRFYKFGPIATWRLESFSRIGFVISLIACCIYGFPYLFLPLVALFCFFIRLFTQIFVINKTAENLRLQKFYLTIPLFDLFQPFMNIYFFTYRIFKGKEFYTSKI